MAEKKHILIDDPNYRIEMILPEPFNPTYEGKMLVGFGEIGSGLDDPGFGEGLAVKMGIAYASVKQRNRTQYQYLAREIVEEALAPFMIEYDLYFYGASIGGYCAAYYSRPLGANFLALSPRLPVHPITDRRIPIRFKSVGYKHDEIYSGYVPAEGARRIVLLDEDNPVDNFYVRTDLALAFEDLEIHHVPNAGHYVPRALLLSGELKTVVTDFLNGSPIRYSLNHTELLKWHEERFYSRVERSQFGHASEHLEVLLRNEHPDQIRRHVQALNLAANKRST